MSYSTVLAIYYGDRIEYLNDLKNSHGSAPYIWDALCKKYFPMGNWLTSSQSIWGLYSNKNIPFHHRSVLGMTLDGNYIPQKDYARAASDIRRFLEEFDMPDRVSHWGYIAGLLEGNFNYPGFALYQTSLGDNPYQGAWDEELEDYGPPPWSNIWSLYDELECKT